MCGESVVCWLQQKRCVINTDGFWPYQFYVLGDTECNKIPVESKIKK